MSLPAKIPQGSDSARANRSQGKEKETWLLSERDSAHLSQNQRSFGPGYPDGHMPASDRGQR